MGRFSGYSPRLGNPLPGLTARPLPKERCPSETRHMFIRLPPPSPCSTGEGEVLILWFWSLP